ncbi:unnamed protein product [Vicia faba]|uniref:Uncharacterized protein n=1 Tax=Vicia faba TaxID=3906 RepID=A0AAV1A8R4_VICFA|nr:unnamed protein product [Vicia faba]
MKRASLKFNPVDSHASENSQSSNLDDKRIRLERRWRRREITVDSLKHTRGASATKTILRDTNDHMRDDQVDEEWKTFFATYTSDNDEELDEDYCSFWATFNSNIETGSASNHSGGSNIDIDESHETDEEYVSFLAAYDLDFENDSAGNQSGGSNVDVNFGNNNASEEIEEGDNCFSNQFVSDYISNGVGVDEDDQLLRKSSSVGQNSLVSEQDTPEVQCVVDEDYEQFLNSGSVVDGDFVYGCDENTKNTSNVENESTKNTSNVEDESNSSDSDLIVLESYPNCENTPFVSSKAYDPSCFGEEMHPEDNMQTTSFFHSQFRKRLMEYLDRPYDYQEYKSLLVQAYERKVRERHLETRRGVIRSYRSVGVSKSYLQVHSDLTEAIVMESKKKPRVLFLLRGLFFWLENLSHEGQFQPWRDESCLEIMRKM